MKNLAYITIFDFIFSLYREVVGVDHQVGPSICPSMCIYQYNGGLVKFLKEVAGNLKISLSHNIKNYIYYLGVSSSVLKTHTNSGLQNKGLHTTADSTAGYSLKWRCRNRCAKFNLISYLV